jgi:flagellar export protein FliJ
MAFQFPLETLLRLYNSYERKEEMRLAEIARERNALREHIAEIEAESRAAAAAQSREMASGVTASEMHFAAACEDTREQKHGALSAQLVEVEKAHCKQQSVYLEARQKREILESLRDRKVAEYQREELRREQRAADDLYLLSNGSKTIANKRVSA